MKKWIILFVLIAFPAGFLFAHPASEINSNLNLKDKTIAIEVIHPLAKAKISDPKKHYIKEITITVNGKKAGTKSFTSQTGDVQKTSFKINAKAGDKIAITARCNLAGVKTAEIIAK